MNFIFAQYILLATLLYLVVEGDHSPLDYEFSTSLHAKYNLYWDTPTDGKICMAVQVETLGWVGFGISPHGGMVDSDIMMAWVIDGEVTITDRFAVSMSLPVLDSPDHQDFELINGYEEDGKTTIEFCRELQTCDENDIELVVGAVKIIYSWNEFDPNPTPLQHSTRGIKGLKLIGNLKEFPAALEDTQQWPMTMNDAEIPNSDTTIYWCRTIPIIQPATKKHIIKIGAHIDPRNTDYIHHLIMYTCSDTFPELIGDCFDSDGIIETSGVRSSCTANVITGWAVGATDLDLPLEAGIPIGPSETYDTVLLEVHYNNPNLDTGIIDSSGLIWYITDNLRTHDIGVFFIGSPVIPDMTIPPQAESFLIPGYCPAECTNQLFQQPMHVVASFLHSHTAGASMWTQIIRDNKEIGYVDLNLNYDFDFQGFIRHEDPVVLLPGDELIVNCLYNTKGRDEFTPGGFGTGEEMCLNFFWYYPKMDISYCLSSFNKDNTFAAALDSFQCNNVDIQGSTTHEELISRASSIEWTDDIARTLEISPLVHPDGLAILCDLDITMDVKFPFPGVDYEVFPYREDTCGNYNGTYYPGGSSADYYYNCNTDEPYYNPIGPTDSAVSLILLPAVMWMLVVAVLSLF